MRAGTNICIAFLVISLDLVSALRFSAEITRGTNRRTWLSLAAAGCSARPAFAASGLADLYDAEAATYDTAYSGSLVSRAIAFDKLRDSVVSKASGQVLELGVGTGLNLPFYKESMVNSLIGIDISTGMLEQARRRVATLPIAQRAVQLTVADAAALPFDADRFDTVVDTFSLCVFERPGVVLAEAKRVLRPGGKLIMLEHDDGPLSRAMAFTRGTSSIASTCAYDQDVQALVRDAGLTIRETSVAAGGFLREVVAEKPV